MKKTTLDTQLVKQKVSVEHLALGMYVTELDRPWLESPFLFQGFFLTTEQHISLVQENCEFVYIDTTRIIEKESSFLREEKRKNIVYPCLL